MFFCDFCFIQEASDFAYLQSPQACYIGWLSRKHTPETGEKYDCIKTHVWR
jgi:hypothetical protein